MRPTKDKVKSKNSGFKKGHSFFPNKEVADILIAAVRASPTKTLIPKPRRSKRLLEQTEGAKCETTRNQYIICNVDCLEDLIHASVQHLMLHPDCKGRLQLHCNEMRLISGVWSLICPICHFATGSKKLFREVKTSATQQGGKLSSTLNLALGNAILNSPIGVEPVRELFMRIGVDPGSASGLQKIISNKSNQTIIDLAEANMKAERKKLSTEFYSDGIRVGVDGRYNNRPSGHSMFQSGTQAVFSVVEDMTAAKKVIHLTLESKLCSTKRALEAAGKPANCPNHEGCTATLKPSDAIGLESRAALNSAMDLHIANVKVAEVTNDCDSKIIKSFRMIFGKEVNNLKDTRHFSLAQKRWCIKSPFSIKMFPGKTKAKRNKGKRWFAEDLRMRCSAELKKAIRRVDKMDKSNQDVKVLINKQLQFTTEAILMCYQGDCSMCAKHSLCCDPAANRPWPKLFVPKFARKGLKMTDDDKDQLELLILLRLGPDAIKVSYVITDTQKNEAFNRSLQKYNSKTVTCTKTWTGRVHASVLNINAGFEDASRQIMAAASHNICGVVEKQIQKRNSYISFKKNYEKMSSVKTKRVHVRKRWNTIHEEKAEGVGPANDLGYLPGCDGPQLQDMSPVAGPRYVF